MLTALLIWFAFAVPVAVAVGRMLAGAPDGTPPAPPPPARQRRLDLVRN